MKNPRLLRKKTCMIQMYSKVVLKSMISFR